MRFTALEIEGAWLIELERHADERGWFARTYCRDELAAHGIDPTVAQESISWNEARHTLRGMHLQTGEAAEGKHVRCTAGAVYDVLVDVRPDSATRLRWVATELTAERGATIYAPPGVAHGFLTLVPATAVEYRMTVAHDAAAGAGYRWDDPAFGIEWPAAPAVMSERDATWAAHPGR